MTVPSLRLLVCLCAGCLALAACSKRNPAYSNYDVGPALDGIVAGDSGSRRDAGAPALDAWTPPPPPLLDLGPAACLTNAECAPSDYCLFTSGCGQDGPGTCTTRPQFCPEYYSPVCGCDDKTYGNDCEAASAGVSVAHAGKCKNDKQCNALNNAYVAAVKAAKLCAPMLPVVQCQLLVKSALHCGCPTYVEQGNTSALAAMNQAKSDFQALGCIPYECGMACPQPQKGNCDYNANGTASCQ